MRGKLEFQGSAKPLLLLEDQFSFSFLRALELEDSAKLLLLPLTPYECWFSFQLPPPPQIELILEKPNLGVLRRPIVRIRGEFEFSCVYDFISHSLPFVGFKLLSPMPLCSAANVINLPFIIFFRFFFFFSSLKSSFIVYHSPKHSRAAQCSQHLLLPKFWRVSTRRNIRRVRRESSLKRRWL